VCALATKKFWFTRDSAVDRWRIKATLTYMLVTKPRNLHYRYCTLQYWYGNLSLSFLVM
jgi:hypothetical protein